MKTIIGSPVIRNLFIFLIIAISWKSCHAQTTETVNNSTTKNGTIDGSIDLETLSSFGISPELAEQFRLNLIKAIEAEEKQPDQFRQEFGGVSGGFYQGGGGGGQGGGGGAGGTGAGGEEEGEDDYDEEMMGAATPGPGAFGVLSGLFGIFSGLGTLNPSRIIQSTVNFFPPGQRMQAQMIVDSLIGYMPPTNRTMRPRPRPRTTPLPQNAMNGSADSMVIAKANETMVVAKDGESMMMLGNSTDAMNMAVMTNASSVDTNETVITGSGGEPMPMAELVKPTEPAPIITTTQGPISLKELFRHSSTPVPPTNEDDEVEFDKKFFTSPKPPKESPSAS